MISINDIYIDINFDDFYIDKKRNNSIKNHPEKNKYIEEHCDKCESLKEEKSNEYVNSSQFAFKHRISKNILTIEERINNLPEDLQRKIYIDYFGSLYIFNKFINERLNMIESKRLSNCKIINIMPYIINNETIVKFLSENNNEFRLTYKDHMNGKKNFKLMDWINSISLSWLYYTYH